MRINPEEAKKLVRKHYLKAILAVILLVLLSCIFNTSIKSLIVMSAFIVLGSFSTFYFNYARVPIHFETVKLGTILCAVAYGAYAGFVVGIIATFFGKVLVGRIDEKLPISMIAISLAAVAASIFSEVEIAALGIFIVLTYNILMFALTQLLGGDIAWNLPYEASNFIINLLLFARIAPWLLPAIQ